MLNHERANPQFIVIIVRTFESVRNAGASKRTDATSEHEPLRSSIPVVFIAVDNTGWGDWSTAKR